MKQFNKKQFFYEMEEKFVFPIGRRTWQILAFVCLLGMTVFISWFFINLTPTKREKVKVSKKEMITNKIDTINTANDTQASACMLKDYNVYIDSLKQDLPNAEWKNLETITEPYNDYVRDEYGNLVMDENGNYTMVYKQDTIKNEYAIPNILNQIYEEKGLDSTKICERIETLKGIRYYTNLFDSTVYSLEPIFINITNFLKGGGDLNISDLKKASVLYSKIEGAPVKIKSQDEERNFIKYYEFILNKEISDKKTQICINLIQEHKKIKDPVFDKNNYFDLAKIILESEIETEDLDAALEEFEKDIKYYDKNGLDYSLRKYLSLYSQKLESAEANKQMKEFEKSQNRIFSLTGIGISFLGVLIIATMLLLYSIQQLLKNHLTNKER